MDIKMPDLKVVLEKLSFLRNNLALLVPIILVVVAGLLFVPTILLSKGLQAKIETESVSKGEKLMRDLDKGVVPEKQAEVQRQYQLDYAKDANQIELMDLQTSQRALLNYKIFPEPRDTSVLIFENFGKNYKAGIEAMVERGQAKECPTAAELGMRQDGRRGPGGRGAMDPYGGGYGYGGYQMPGAENTGMSGFENAQKINDAICMERASTASFYVSFADIAGYNYWSDYSYDSSTDEAVEDCWYWQLGYWIIQDVFDTIQACNRGSNSVFSSPVKRLTRVGFDRGMNMMMLMGRGGRSDDKTMGRPLYVKDKFTVLAPPCTGRVCDDDIDVVQFNVVVVVEAQYVLTFMKRLCSEKENVFSGWNGQAPEQHFKHNQITILEVNASTPERQSPKHNRYRYGEDGVVELNLICEYVFVKAALADVIPPVVVKALKGEDEGQQ